MVAWGWPLPAWLPSETLERPDSSPGHGDSFSKQERALQQFLTTIAAQQATGRDDAVVRDAATLGRQALVNERELEWLAERQPKHNYLRIPKRPMISTYPWGLTLRR